MSLAHLFLPHHQGRRRAKLIHHPALFSYIFFVVCLIYTVNFLSWKLPGVLGYASDIKVSDLLALTNQERVERGLGSLAFSETLSQAAQSKAEHMFAHNYWAHVGPDGAEPWEFITGAGYRYLYAGENLARDFQHSQPVVAAWLDSPSHRDNLLSSRYEEIGLAVVNGILDGRETTLVVQMFGKPQTPTYRAELAPVSPVTTEVGGPAEELGVTTEVTKSLVPKEETVSVVVNPEIEETAPRAKSPVVLIGVREQVLPAIDVYNAARTISLVLGSFLLLLLTVDFWYARRTGLVRLSGNTLAHILFLLAALVGVWYVNVGVIL